MNKKSFTLIEVLVFVTILTMVFITAISLTVVSLRNIKVNEHKILATHYGEELLEWLRGEKEIDWNTFISRTASADFCFNNLNWDFDGSCNYSLCSIFKRTASFTNISSGGYVYQVNISIIVEWQDLGNTYQVPINTVFSIWE
ncbi:MAG: hypothetical protein N2482_02205 [Patescibacteria group bacterium]|nr:hypothetical protein [Patescibacteria group bacterium]